MDLLNKNLGSVANVDVQLSGGGLSATVSVPLSALVDELGAKLKAKYPASPTMALIVDAVVAEFKTLVNK
jgi:hypothetical protein